MYTYARWEKETQKANLEEIGVTSQSKALQILIDHFLELSQYKPDHSIEGYAAVTKIAARRDLQQSIVQFSATELRRANQNQADRRSGGLPGEQIPLKAHPA